MKYGNGGELKKQVAFRSSPPLQRKDYNEQNTKHSTFRGHILYNMKEHFCVDLLNYLVFKLLKPSSSTVDSDINSFLNGLSNDRLHSKGTKKMLLQGNVISKSHNIMQFEIFCVISQLTNKLFKTVSASMVD